MITKLNLYDTRQDIALIEELTHIGEYIYRSTVVQYHSNIVVLVNASREDSY